MMTDQELIARAADGETIGNGRKQIDALLRYIRKHLGEAHPLNQAGLSPEAQVHFSPEARSFEESYLAIRAAGGDAWDGLDVAKELAEMRGYDIADDEAETK